MLPDLTEMEEPNLQGMNGSMHGEHQTDELLTECMNGESNMVFINGFLISVVD